MAQSVRTIPLLGPKTGPASDKFDTLADFTAAGGAASYGVGPLWIGGVQYWSDGNNIKIIAGGGGFYSAGTEKVLCDWRGDLAPSLWSKSDAGASIVKATDSPGGISFEGGDVVRLLSNAAGGCNYTSPTFTAKSIGTNGTWINLRIPMYFPEWKYNATSTGESVIVDIGTSADLANRFSLYNVAAGQSLDINSNPVFVDKLVGWNDLIIPLNNIAAPVNTNLTTIAQSGVPDLSSIVKLRIQLKRYDTNDIRPVYLGPISYGLKPIPKIMFSFDDGDPSIYTTAFPILEKYGFKACFFTVGSQIGANGKITEAQLQELKAAGWTIANHTQNHFNHNLDAKTYDERYNDIAQHKRWLKDKGFDHDIFAWPGGSVSASSKEILRELEVKAAFSYTATNTGMLINLPPTAYFANRYAFGRIPIEGSTTQVITNSETYINHAINTGGHIVFSTHTVTSSPTSTTNLNTTEFETVLQKILQRVRDGVVEVVTIRDFVDSGNYSDY